MGMFDTVVCYFPLPDPEAQGRRFQTKSFQDACMELYFITEDGRLEKELRRWDNTLKLFVPDAIQQEDYHGDVVFYDFLDDDRPRETWYEYRARFTEGRVQWIRRTAEHCKSKTRKENERE